MQPTRPNRGPWQLELVSNKGACAWRMKMQGVPMRALLFTLACLMATFMASAERDHEIDLSGVWKFQVDHNDVGIDERWFGGRLADAIVLPGSMAEHQRGDRVGFDTVFTGNFWKEYPAGVSWRDDPNYAPFLRDGEYRFPFWLISEYHYVGVAWYQREFVVPDGWAGSNVELLLERCHWETRVWVDDEPIGMRNALGVPHRYDLGDGLAPGVHTVTVRVDNSVGDIAVGVDAHSVSDNTQSNWNGIVGDIKLVRRPAVSIERVDAYPDVDARSVRLELLVANNTGEPRSAMIELSAQLVSPTRGPELPPLRVNVELDPGANEHSEVYPLGAGMRLWDEFDPNLYELTATLTSAAGVDVATSSFGMRHLRGTDKGLLINDRPLFLRGTLECAIFPKTGYPPTEAEPWERLIRIAKEHGLNHIRFHSWCPPKAAFEAADRLGFYFQVEASAWVGDLGSGKPIDRWVYEESERMVAEYGNHPSFCLMAYGNEPHGENHRPYLIDFVRHWKPRDPRRLYTSGAGWPVIDENDFHNIYHGTRIQGWNANLTSIINREPPRSDYDWNKKTSQLGAPVVSHEVGQWCVYPNFNEIPKYDGVLRATNFEIFRDSLDSKGLLHLADDFVHASGKLQALCYKADIEAALRSDGFAGFQLLDLRDFPGQGTALVGILDPFWDEKGYISPAEFRRFSNETVPLARLPKHIFTSSERVVCDIEVAHYGPAELEAVTPRWEIISSAGETIRSGTLATRPLQWGSRQKLGRINESLPVDVASRFELRVEVAGFENVWDFWVYPERLPTIGGDILVTRTIDDRAAKRLKEGGRVLLTVEKGSIRNGMGGEVGVGFSSIFWNTAWTNGQLPHTLGILCDPTHPALAEFPTESHSNWQWWDAMSHCDAVSLEGFETTPEPIVRIIDDWVTNRNLGMLFELQVGRGRLLVSGVDLVSDLDTRPEARQLLYSITKYMASDAFAPTTNAAVAEVRPLFKSDSERLKDGATATASSFESGYEPSNLLDSNPSTLWHTAWKTNSPSHPHTVTIDLGRGVTLAGLACLQRQDGNPNGLVAELDVYFSLSVDDRGRLLKTAVLSRQPARQVIEFDEPLQGRYLTLVATGGFDGDSMASLAEIELLVDDEAKPSR